MDTETKSTPPDTESFSPNVEILSEQMKEVQQKLAEHLYAAITSEFGDRFDTRGFLGDRGIFDMHNTQRILYSPALRRW